MTKVKGKGYGVVAKSEIPADTFITEYAGEVITEDEKKRRTETRYVPYFPLSLRHARTNKGRTIHTWQYDTKWLSFGDLTRDISQISFYIDRERRREMEEANYT